MAELRYRGREIDREDILYIRTLIERYPKESRRKLSTRICEAWQWRQANGALRDMVCRGMLLMLERAGQITLPPVSYVRHNPLAQRTRPEPVLIDKTPIEDPLRKLQPLKFEQVRRTAQEPLFNSLMEEHHYLGYEQPVGEHLKYLVWAEGRPIACLAWSSAPRHLGSRDRYIGCGCGQPVGLMACRSGMLDVNVDGTIGIRYEPGTITHAVPIDRIRHELILQVAHGERPECAIRRELSCRKVHDVVVMAGKHSARIIVVRVPVHSLLRHVDWAGEYGGTGPPQDNADAGLTAPVHGGPVVDLRDMGVRDDLERDETQHAANDDALHYVRENVPPEQQRT